MEPHNQIIHQLAKLTEAVDSLAAKIDRISDTADKRMTRLEDGLGKLAGNTAVTHAQVVDNKKKLAVLPPLSRRHSEH